MSDLTPEALDELERLHAAATPGEWRVELARSVMWIRSALRDIVGLSVSPPRVPEREIRDEHVRRAKADAASIAALHNAAPALIATAREAAEIRTRLEVAERERDEARAEVGRLRVEVTELTDPDNRFRALLDWRGVTVPCPICTGSGRRGYANTATWRGGAGGQMMTDDVCDACWGSGDADRPGVDLRRALKAEREVDAYKHANDIAVIAIGERDAARRGHDALRNLLVLSALHPDPSSAELDRAARECAAADADLVAACVVGWREQARTEVKRLRVATGDISAETEAHMTDAMFGRRRA